MAQNDIKVSRCVTGCKNYFFMHCSNERKTESKGQRTKRIDRWHWDGQSIIGLFGSLPVTWILLLLITWGTLLLLQYPEDLTHMHKLMSLYLLVTREACTFCPHPPILGCFFLENVAVQCLKCILEQSSAGREGRSTECLQLFCTFVNDLGDGTEYANLCRKLVRMKDANERKG